MLRSFQRVCVWKVFVAVCVCVSASVSDCVGLCSVVNNELVPPPMARWRIWTAVAAVWELPYITARINQHGVPPRRLRATSQSTAASTPDIWSGTIAKPGIKSACVYSWGHITTCSPAWKYVVHSVMIRLRALDPVQCVYPCSTRDLR